MSIEEPMDTLLNARFQFRNLLDTHGLVLLAGSEADAIDWLSSQVIEIADTVARRERLQALIQQTKNRLERGREEGKASPNGERKERSNPYVEARFRKFRI